jgi:hypothetical protein
LQQHSRRLYGCGSSNCSSRTTAGDCMAAAATVPVAAQRPIALLQHQQYSSAEWLGMQIGYTLRD